MKSTNEPMVSRGNYKRLIFFMAFSLLLVFLSAFYIYSSYGDAKTLVKNRLMNDSFLIGEWIKGGFQSSDYVLRDIVSQVALSELVYPNPNPEMYLQRKEFLEEKRKSLKNAIFIGLFNRDCIITHSNDLDGFDASESDYCKVMKNQSQLQSIISHAFLSDDGRINVTQGRKFNKTEDGFNGMVAIAVNLSFFSELINSLHHGESSVMIILDTRMTLLARKPSLPEKIGKKINAVHVEKFIESGNKFMLIDTKSPLDVTERLFVFRKIDGLPFVVVIGEASQVWQAERMARTDMLTGLDNRLAFFEKGESEYSRYRRYGGALSVIMLDLDYFKSLNDTHGHGVGDLVLESLGQILRTALRRNDIAGRVGGEEFAVILPETNIEHATYLANRLKKAIESSQFNTLEDPVLCTASFGVAQANIETDTFKSLLKCADDALYMAKKEGRNRVVSF